MPKDRDTRFDAANPFDPETGTLRTPLSEALKQVSPFDSEGVLKTAMKSQLEKASLVDRRTGAPKQ